MKAMLLIFIAALAAVAPAAEKDGASDKESVVAAMNAYKTAMIHNDRAAMEKLLADELRYVHSSGKIETKADVLKFSSVTQDVVFYPDRTVHIYGQTATVTESEDWVHPGATSKVLVLIVWKKGPGGWQIVAREATKRP
jgi:hypothetical protein